MLRAIPAAEATHYRGMRHFPSANLINDEGQYMNMKMKKIKYQS
jgi:hypothetical protein